MSYIPRGPMHRGGELTREWRDYLARRISAPPPRSPMTPRVGRPWLEWWRSGGAETLPYGPLFDAGGYVSAEWRDWISKL